MTLQEGKQRVQQTGYFTVSICNEIVPLFSIIDVYEGKRKNQMKIAARILIAGTITSASAFVPAARTQSTETALQGLFDSWRAGGTASQDDLDEQWQRQQEILANRRDPNKKKAYFDKVEDDRKEASRKQSEMWSWQTKKYGKGEDPIDEWRKRRADGTISDLDNQYGDPKKIGGIPIPGASFGIGGEFGVG